MKNGLITAHDIKKEDFNSLSLSVSNISQFLAYYTLILTTAYQYDLISEKEAKKISDLILNSFKETFEFDALVMSNNMYVLTLFLKSMNNVKQLETLSKVSNSKEAKALFDEANIWFSKRINILKYKLSSLTPKVLKIGNQILTDSFNELLSDLKELNTYSSSKTSCNFKKLHDTSIILRYPFLHTYVKKENYLDELQSAINSLEKEVCILYKLNPKEIIANLEQSFKEDLDSSIYDNIHNESKILFQLKELEEEYQRKLKEAQASSNSFDDALHQLELADKETFKKMHPELTGDAFEEAFEDWQFSLPDSHFEIEEEYIDEMEIKAEYEKKRELLIKKLEDLEKSNEKKVLENNFAQEIDLSLEVVLKILAMLELFKINSNFHLPETNSKLSNALEKIPLSTAINIITKTIKPDLSESELSYLEGN